VLSQYSEGCQIAHTGGEDVVAGRPAYKIVVSTDVDACRELYAPKEPEKLGPLTVWVDKESFLPLKTEQLDATGAPMYVYEVTQIEVGDDIPDSAFAFQAPPGTTVQDVADMTEAKFVLSGYTGRRPRAVTQT
jgi:negative regulator of sigma E activity